MTATRRSTVAMYGGRRLTCALVLALATGGVLTGCGDTPGTASPSTVTVTATSSPSAPTASSSAAAETDVSGGDSASGGEDSGGSGSGAQQATASCDPDSGVPSTVSADMRRIAPPITSPTWRVSQVGGNPCVGLSWVEVFASAAVIQPPRQLLIYHDGRFLGTGIRCQTRYPEYVSLPANNGIRVTYRYPDPSDPLQSTTQNPVGVANVEFRWNGSRIVMEGTLPYEITRGRC